MNVLKNKLANINTLSIVWVRVYGCKQLSHKVVYMRKTLSNELGDGVVFSTFMATYLPRETGLPYT